MATPMPAGDLLHLVFAGDLVPAGITLVTPGLDHTSLDYWQQNDCL